MADYFFALKDRFDVADGTKAFIFDTAGSDFNFRAGQYIEVGLENPLYTDQKKNHRDFSIASSPADKDVVMVAARMESASRPISAFKKSMAEVPIGTKFKIEGPYGSFTLDDNISEKAVFIAGGIGITPARSIIKDVTERQLSNKIALIYANRMPDSAAFLDDLWEWEKENTNFRFLATMTDMGNSKRLWDGFISPINADFFKKNLVDFSNSIYYLVGPPGMVAAARKALEECRVAAADMRFEEFTGY